LTPRPRREPIEVRKATASILSKSRPSVRLNEHMEQPERRRCVPATFSRWGWRRLYSGWDRALPPRNPSSDLKLLVWLSPELLIQHASSALYGNLKLRQCPQI
jgi:hypothetical protein